MSVPLAARHEVREAERIRAEYARRDRELPPDRYSITQLWSLFMLQQRERRVLRLLQREALMPLESRRVLDIGCGDGHHLLEFIMWGALPQNLAGIDVIPGRVARARVRLGAVEPGGAAPDLRLGDASHLPWPTASFDVVHQGTVFTSILDARVRTAVAREIVRVLKPDGVFIWYDFRYNNPSNPHVRRVGAGEIRSLFPTCVINLERLTLAPPLARRLVPVSWVGSLVLEKLGVLNTHYLASVRSPGRAEEPRPAV
jgi:SAM-dependent methyltransferase